MKQFVPTLSCFLLLFLFSIRGYAQNLPEDFTKKNSLYVEAGGITPGYSLNYDRLVFQKNSLKIMARAGASMYPVRKGIRQALTELGGERALDYGLISEVSVVLGRRNHHFETGIGYSYSNTVGYRKGYDYNVLTSFYRIDFHNHDLVSHIGYRYQKPSGGLLFRAGLKPIIMVKQVNDARYINVNSGTYDFVIGRSKNYDLSAGLSVGWSF